MRSIAVKSIECRIDPVTGCVARRAKTAGAFGERPKLVDGAGRSNQELPHFSDARSIFSMI